MVRRCEATDHKNLQSAQFIKTAATRSNYRLHAAADGWHPAIYEVALGAFLFRVYELTLEQYEHLLYRTAKHVSVRNFGGWEAITAMLYPQELVEQYNWPDISHYGSWPANIY